MTNGSKEDSLEEKSPSSARSAKDVTTTYVVMHVKGSSWRDRDASVASELSIM